jgi:nucleoside-diphosphate-sugar epimerase
MILVTGASGFVGRAVVESLCESGQSVVAASRKFPEMEDPFQSRKKLAFRWHTVTHLDGNTNWVQALRGVNTIVHCAAIAHFGNKNKTENLLQIRKINVEATINLARQAVLSHVSRFVFISSIGVNGNQSVEPFNEAQMPSPKGEYAISKHEAELALLEVARGSKLEIVILRPPLVYGRNASGSFGRLLKAVETGFPLPFGCINNKRSFLGLGNLVSLVNLCCDRHRSPNAGNQTFVVADGEDLSTTAFLHKVAQAAGCSNRLVPVPVGLLRLGARVIGKSTDIERLLCNLQVDASKVRETLGWKPIINMDDQIASIFRKP